MLQTISHVIQCLAACVGFEVLVAYFYGDCFEKKVFALQPVWRLLAQDSSLSGTTIKKKVLSTGKGSKPTSKDSISTKKTVCPCVI